MKLFSASPVVLAAVALGVSGRVALPATDAVETYSFSLNGNTYVGENHVSKGDDGHPGGGSLRVPDGTPRIFPPHLQRSAKPAHSSSRNAVHADIASLLSRPAVLAPVIAPAASDATAATENLRDVRPLRAAVGLATLIHATEKGHP